MGTSAARFSPKAVSPALASDPDWASAAIKFSTERPSAGARVMNTKQRMEHVENREGRHCRHLYGNATAFNFASPFGTKHCTNLTPDRA
jgi:hypothetical protein